MTKAEIRVGKLETHHGGRPRVYPLYEWFQAIEGLKRDQVLVLMEGIDFKVSMKSMRNYLHRVSKNFGMKIRTWTFEQKLQVAYGGKREDKKKGLTERTTSRKRKAAE